MTDLEKKAEKYAGKIIGSYFYSLATIKEIKQFYKDGYEQGQKEREEQIQIDISWIDKLEKENEELKAQIEKMKTFSNCKNWRKTQGNCMLGNGYCICDKWELAE